MDEVHTDENLAEWVIKCLSDYQVPLEKIIVCCTDNAKNFVSSCKKLFNNICHFSPEETVDMDADEEQDTEESFELVKSPELEIFNSESSED
ncbi:hypothetical protein Ciccas_007230 [Cichlidogyrus casuarinus]|uniref:Uncharacterized protein n=1 Tax=Cichlidogyrus casuarinus TaxID=1844966 RepID=A0ABD2Q461_9PLAT